MEEDQESMLKKLTQMKKEYARKQKKLEKSIRKSKAKAHVKQILQEQEMLRKSEKECGRFKDKKRMSGEIPHSENQYGHSSKTKSDSKIDLNLPKSSANIKSHLLKTPDLSENLDKGDFVIEKTSQSKEDGDKTIGPCGDSEQSASSRNLPSSSESSGKKTLSLKARRRKTLSPNTFSNRRKLSPIETNPTKGVVDSILIPDDEDQEIREINGYDTQDKSVDPVVEENISEIYFKSSKESKLIEKPKPFETESSMESVTLSLDGCENIKTKRRRGRKPRRYKRQSLPGPAMIPGVNSSESQGSQELETLMLVQESLGLGSQRGGRKTRHSHSHQPILLSSVFQFIIDDAKRAQGEKDFVLPTHTFGNLMENKCLHKINSEGVSAGDNVENENNLGDEISVEKKTMNVVEQMPSSVFMHSTQTSYGDKGKEKGKEVNTHTKNGLSVEQDINILNTVLPVKHVKTDSVPLRVQNLKKGNNSDLDRISQSVSKNSNREIVTMKEIHADVNGEVNVKNNNGGIEDVTCGSEVFDGTVCPEDGELESELNSSIGSDQQTESDDENFGDILKERMATQFPADDPVIQSHIAVVLLNRKRTEMVVCLCKKSVSVWALQCDQFSCLQKWAFPEELTALCGDLMLPKSSEVRFTAILQNSTSIQLYSAVFQENQAFPLFKITDISTPSQQMHVCAVEFNELVISQCESANTIKLAKYIMDSEVKTLSRTVTLEETTGILDNVCRIHGQHQAVVGYTKEGLLHIWNHDIGALVLTVNLAVYWPHSSHLVTVFQEKGYLFCPLMAVSDCFLAGCMMLVNPTNCQTKVLFPFNSKKWKGCSTAFHMEDYIAAVNKSGTLHIWDKFSGEMLSCMESADIVALCNHRNNIVVSRAYCIHCFTLK